MNKFYCNGFRSIVGDISISEAASTFASRAARKRYGRRGYCRTCVMSSWSTDGSLAEFQAFIGYTVDMRRNPGETTGHNIHMTVRIQ